jgi:PAS domain S-box-containing protein
MVFVFRDVTARRAEERALAESEENYRYTLELNPQIPWKASADGDITVFSGQWRQLTGLAQESRVAGGWKQVVYEEDLAMVMHAWGHAVATGEPYDLEHRIRTAGGALRWVRSRANPRRGPDGRIVAWYGITEDIHSRKESELALIRQEAALRTRLAQIETMYRAVPVGLGFVDARLRMVEFNEALADIKGLPSGMPGAPSPSDPSTPLGAQVAALYGKVLESRQPLVAAELSGETRARPGIQHDWLASLYPVIEDGRILGIVVAVLEVTQLKQAQRKLIEANQSLEQRIEERTARIAEANEELRAFAHTVAHDLRAPLRNVEGFADALLEDEAERLSEDGKMFVGRIAAAVVRMDRLITDLLAYSRLSRAELRRETVDTSMVVQTALRDLETQARESQAEIVVQPDLPAVLAHQGTLVQVMENLISNAIKFVSPGMVPKIRVTARRDAATVSLRIEDKGIGIAPEHREHVFGVFERLHGQEQYPGTGIGLAIVKKGMERMGGAITILDSPQGGTTFALTLPAPVQNT